MLRISRLYIRFPATSNSGTVWRLADLCGKALPVVDARRCVYRRGKENVQKYESTRVITSPKLFGSTYRVSVDYKRYYFLLVFKANSNVSNHDHFHNYNFL